MKFIIPIVGLAVNENENDENSLFSVKINELNQLLDYSQHSTLSGMSGVFTFKLYHSSEANYYHTLVYENDEDLFDNYMKSRTSYIELEYELDSNSDYLYQVSEIDIKHYLENIILSVHLAIPSRTSFLGIYTVNNDKIEKISDHNTFIDSFFIDMSELTWPKFKRLPIIDVLEWLYSIEGFDQGVPRGQVGRALSSFSYFLLGKDNLLFVWSLIGLEALYGRDSGGKTAQILKKSEILLGERKTHKKKLNSLYNYRSRFLHGDINIPLAYSNWYEADGYSQYLEETNESVILASAVLLCSLQELALRKLTKLVFDYTII